MPTFPYYLFLFLSFNLIKSAPYINHLVFNRYENITSYDGYVIFNSSDFKIGDNMQFILRILEGFIQSGYNNIEYYYINSLNDYREYYNEPFTVDFITTVYYNESFHDYEKRYFIIKKRNEEMGITFGRYLVIKYHTLNNIAFIENIKEDDGSPETLIIIISSVLAALAVIITIYSIVKIKNNCIESSSSNIVIIV